MMRAKICPTLSIVPVLALLASAVPSLAADRPPATPAMSVRDTTARNDPAFVDIILRTHNTERAYWNVPPLSWSASLASDAQIWADHLARTSTFGHDFSSAASAHQGENLWMGTRNAWSHAEMLADWTNERQHYRSGIFPSVSRTRNWTDIAHYTQLIWKDTRRVGCALAQNRAHDFLVCRYDPPGNIAGQIAEQGRATRHRPDRRNVVR